MPKMLRVLDDHPELGCLGYRQWYGRTTIAVQYWKEGLRIARPVRARQGPTVSVAGKGNTAAARIGISTTDEPAVEPH